MIDPQHTVSDIIAAHPECANVLHHHRVAIFSREGQSLGDACRERGLDVERVCADLERAIVAERATACAEPEKMSNPALVTYIVSRYHERVRQSLALVRGLSAKVAQVHGGHQPRLRELAQAVLDLDETVWWHFDDEEACLFFAVTARRIDLPFIRDSLKRMKNEHDSIRALIARVREAADGYRLPAEACSSYRLLFGELARLEEAVQRDLQLENEILLPRFAA